MTDPSKNFGLDDDELLALPTVFAADLLKGRVALVSGGGSGLGKAIAALFARLGATLAICGRDGDKLDRAAVLLRGLGAEVSCHAMTIRDPGAVAALMAAVRV